MPIEVLITWIPHKWILGTLACNLFAAVGEYSTYVSVMTMMTFTFERYTAVCYPLRPSLHSDVKRTRRILLGIWALATLPAVAMTKYIKVFVHYFVKSRPKLVHLTLMKQDTDVFFKQLK